MFFDGTHSRHNERVIHPILRLVLYVFIDPALNTFYFETLSEPR